MFTANCIFLQVICHPGSLRIAFIHKQEDSEDSALCNGRRTFCNYLLVVAVVVDTFLTVDMQIGFPVKVTSTVSSCYNKDNFSSPGPGFEQQLSVVETFSSK